jgi:hypothetical protein
MDKKCSKCGEVKPESEFTRNKNRPDGLTVWCKTCNKKARDSYYLKNKDKIKKRVKAFREENKEHVLTQSKNYRIKYRVKRLIYSAKHRAKSLGLPFDIDCEDIVLPEYCPVLKIKLNIDCNVQSRNSPSIDRIIPMLGYVKGNIQVISWQANTMKNNASVEELKNFATWVLNELDKDTE